MSDNLADLRKSPLSPSCNDLNVIGQFVQTCQEFSERVSVIEDGIASMTYGELLSKSLWVAAILKNIAKEHANKPIDQSAYPVPVYALSLPRSRGYLIALWATWISGGAFFPLDPDLPEQRKAQIIEEANPTFIITPDWLNSIIDSQAYTDHCMIELPVIVPRQLAYLIFTSGSTGTPKGVMVSHDGLMNLFQAQKKMFQVTPQSRYFWYLSPQFDASISDILVTFLSGATLIFETISMTEQALSLPRLVEKRAITHLDIPPSLLKLLSPIQMPSCLETVVIGGESPEPEMVRNWANHVRLINVYGPTETTVCTSMILCHADWNKPFLGQPLPNIIYRIADEPVGNEANGNETGELLIGGSCVALGYLNNSALTQEKFFSENEVSYFRTGDRVRRVKSKVDESIEYEFIGRLDRQVKWQGKRIELEEIEAHLLNLSNFQRVSVQLFTALNNSPGKQNLIAFIERNELDADERNETLVSLPDEARLIQQQLKQSLPDWMIPNAFYFSTRLPSTHSGKIDLKKLEKLYFERHVLGDLEQSNDHSIAEEVSGLKWFQEAFSKVTGFQSIQPDDDFFQMGGDSLGVVELLYLCEKSGIHLGSDLIYANPTPRLLAEISLLGTDSDVNFMTRQALFQTLPAIPKVDLKDLAKSSKQTTILLTGATGFLGSAVCYELIKSMTESFIETKQVYCLVRASSKIQAKERVKATFKKYGLWDLLNTNANLRNLFDTQINFVCGDISEPDLGLGKLEYEEMLNQVSVVIHCGAVVNMLQAYEQLYDPNVLSLKHLSEFCLTQKRKAFHYASTLSVFVGTNHNRGHVFETDKLENVTQIYGGYAQTKVAAELYLNQVKEQYPEDFQPAIYRFGLLTGSTHSGCSSEKDFLTMFIKGANQFKCLPSGDLIPLLAVDITPVDEAARVFVGLVLNKNPRYWIYHIANEKPLYYSEWLERMKSCEMIHRTEDVSQWEANAYAIDLTKEQQLTLKALCRLNPLTYEKNRIFDLFQATDIQFDQSHVRDEGFLPITSVPSELISLYIQQFYLEQGFYTEKVPSP